jgi:hypothetical protein
MGRASKSIVTTNFQPGDKVMADWKPRLRLTIIILFALVTLVAYGHAGSAAKPSTTIALIIALPEEHILIGQIPWVHLTVKNLTNEDISYPEDRVQVMGEKGEPPTTLRQRQLTNRRQPSEPSILGGGFEPTIEPGGSFTRRYDLSQLYDLSKPGKYTVYIEVLDEFNSRRGKGGWVRSPIATFEIQAPPR